MGREKLLALWISRTPPGARECSSCVITQQSLQDPRQWGCGTVWGHAALVHTHLRSRVACPLWLLLLPGAFGAAEPPGTAGLVSLETKPVFQLWELPRRHPDR